MTTMIPSTVELVWIAIALVGPLLWVPIRSSIEKHYWKRNRNVVICGGPHGNFSSPPSHSSEGLVVLLWKCCSAISGFIAHYYYTIKNSWKRPRNQNRVTFAQHSTGQVRTERFHFFKENAANQPVVPEVSTPPPVPPSRRSNNEDRPKPRLLAPNTPPPKSFRNKRHNTAILREETPPTSRQEATTTRRDSSSPLDRRSLVMHQYQTSPFMSRSVRAMPVSTTPLSIQYQEQQQSGGRKRRHDVDEEPVTKRRRIPLKAFTPNHKSGRFPLKTSSTQKSKRKSLESTEAWLLQEFNRKRPEKKQATDNSNTTVTQPTRRTSTQNVSTPASGSGSVNAAFSFGGSTDTPASNTRDEAPKAAFTFGAASTTTAQDTATPSVSSTATSAAAPSQTTPATGGGGFTFGQSDSTSNKPPATAAASSSTPSTPAAGAFTFRTTAAGDDSAKVSATTDNSATPVASTGGGFTLGANSTSAQPASTPAMTGTFSIGQASSDDNKTKQPATLTGGFSFGEFGTAAPQSDASKQAFVPGTMQPPSSTPASTPGTFSFGQSSSDSISKPPASSMGGFSFGGGSTADSSKAAFVPGTTQPPTSTPASTSGTFSFGQSSSDSTSKPPVTSTGGFSFGGSSATALQSDSSKASFVPVSTRPPTSTPATAPGTFSFGQPSSDTSSTSKPPATSTDGFSFGTSSAPQSDSKPAFTPAGSGIAAPPATPGFFFGNTTNMTPSQAVPQQAPSSFGSQTTTTPSFGTAPSFGAAAAASVSGAAARRRAKRQGRRR